MSIGARARLTKVSNPRLVELEMAVAVVEPFRCPAPNLLVRIENQFVD